ncbi:MAG TPA: HPr family phosphocarrier protein [Candidatus Merdenecus merdavium]|nr:HPr family phosphocarrier protein [Candidatus Merdenecus merdavium]
MTQRKIKLTKTDDVREFVQAASKCDFDIDVFYNRVIIDAKSILGVLSMDLTKILTVKYQGSDQRFEEALDKFVIA